MDASSFFIVAYVKVFVTEKSEGSIVTNPDCFSPNMRFGGGAVDTYVAG